MDFHTFIQQKELHHEITLLLLNNFILMKKTYLNLELIQQDIIELIIEDSKTITTYSLFTNKELVHIVMCLVGSEPNDKNDPNENFIYVLAIHVNLMYAKWFEKIKPFNIHIPNFIMKKIHLYKKHDTFEKLSERPHIHQMIREIDPNSYILKGISDYHSIFFHVGQYNNRYY